MSVGVARSAVLPSNPLLTQMYSSSMSSRRTLNDSALIRNQTFAPPRMEPHDSILILSSPAAMSLTNSANVRFWMICQSFETTPNTSSESRRTFIRKSSTIILRPLGNVTSGMIWSTSHNMPTRSAPSIASTSSSMIVPSPCHAALPLFNNNESQLVIS